MPGKKYKKVPRYFGLRIYLLSTMMYFFMAFPVAGILLFKYIPDYMTSNRENMIDNTVSPLSRASENFSQDTLLLDHPESDFIHIRISDSMRQSLVINPDTLISQEGIQEPETIGISEDNKIGGTMSLLIRLLLISFILGFAFNLPFKIFFRKKRKGKQIPPKLHKYCRKLLLKTPLINAGILFISYGITIFYMVYILLFEENLDEINRQFYNQFFFISIVSSMLALLFVYFWQKHRVHIKYLEYIFGKEELKRRIFNIKAGRIRNRLWISASMTTLLPLLIVLFYLFLTVTTVKDLNIEELNDDHVSILLGKYNTLDMGFGGKAIANLFYVNVINSLLMFIGIGTGIAVAFMYLLFFVRWTTEDIVYPVKELVKHMQSAGQGDLDNYSIVRTNDEIGELTEGFNEMSEKLKEYIQNIFEINEANSRFVPNQFLEYLGKNSIAEIKLGDQIQKEMTVLFTDIREFTSISEQMTPKENFDFLNNYLGYMEPVISNNNGFIDKFIGDSIMALFPEKAEDALNAAIEMRIKLTEFNHITSQFGKPPIDSGIGIHTGTLMLGIVGGEGRMDGTVISDAVNLTSRVEGLTKLYGSSVIITEDTLIKLSDPSLYNFRFLDIVRVKGKKEAVYIFELIDGEPEHNKNLKMLTKEQFGKAVQLYKKRDFEEALKLFNKIITQNPEDKTISLYIERCRRYIRNGVPPDWDGTEELGFKI